LASAVLGIERIDDDFADGFQGRENTDTLVSLSLEGGDVMPIQMGIQLFDAGDPRKVAFVVLEDEGHCTKVDAIFLQVLLKVFQTFKVLGHFVALTVGDKHDPIHATEHELASGVVVHLAGDRVQLKFGGKALDRTEVQGKKIKEQGPVSFCRQTDHFTLGLVRNLAVDDLQVRGLARQAWSVVDDFAGNFAGRVVDRCHGSADRLGRLPHFDSDESDIHIAGSQDDEPTETDLQDEHLAHLALQEDLLDRARSTGFGDAVAGIGEGRGEGGYEIRSARIGHFGCDEDAV